MSCRKKPALVHRWLEQPWEQAVNAGIGLEVQHLGPSVNDAHETADRGCGPMALSLHPYVFFDLVNITMLDDSHFILVWELRKLHSEMVERPYQGIQVQTKGEGKLQIEL